MADNRALNRILRRMTKIKLFLERPNEAKLGDVKLKLVQLEDEWTEYKAVEGSIKDTTEVTELKDKIESDHFDIKECLKKFECDLINVSGDNSDAHNCTLNDLLLNQRSFLDEISHFNKSSGESEVRLPRITLPNFSGIYDEFPSFKDLFEASIDKNQNISNAHKLQYLKGLLKGEAADLVRHIPITAANYREAWEIIKLRYDKKKHVLSKLIHKFLNQPAISYPSSKSLHHMADLSDEVLRGLKVLGEEAETRDPWLISLLVNKLDIETQQAWALDPTNVDFPKMKEFFEFLNRRSDALETCELQKRISISRPKGNHVKSLHSSVYIRKCPKCELNHLLFECEEFLELPVHDRRGFIAGNKLCFNCMRSGHQAFDCRSSYKCNQCGRRHHSTLHQDTDVSLNNVGTSLIQNEPLDSPVHTSQDSSNSATAKDDIITLNTSMTEHFQAILPTAVVKIKDGYGCQRQCRVLLDSGAQASFISESCMQRLKLKRKNARISVSGFAEGSLYTKGVTTITAISCYSENDKITIDALILDKLPSRIPQQLLHVKDFNNIADLKFADHNFEAPADIDLVIGADKFFSILCEGTIKRLAGSLIAQKTIFGWVIAGKESKQTIYPHLKIHNAILHDNTDKNMDSMLQSFWEIEEIVQEKLLTSEEQDCEDHFQATYTRKNGKYLVRIPFKQNTTTPANSLIIAQKRFFFLEKRFSIDESFKREYQQVIREYIDMGHMREISKVEMAKHEKLCYYLPHHAVRKEDSTTTKVRVVFDGSSKTNNGMSLNENMMVGPTIQPSLYSILLRFRFHKVVITGDIEKMYRQVMIHEHDQDFQRILWRETTETPLKHYALTTVTFGLAASAYLAIRCLHQASLDNEKQYPHAAQIIRTDFYVDDFLSGAETIEEVRELKQNVDNILHYGGFKLRKCRSNENALYEEVGESIMSFCDTVHKLLGLQWDCKADNFFFQVKIPVDQHATKRSLISCSSKIFDPLGWLSPSTIIAKLLFQRLWLKKIDWDEKLPEDINDTWIKLNKQFKELEKIKIPRYIPKNDIEIHGFCDASQLAYAAVIYIRSSDDKGEITTNLLTSKTKVAPIKQISLPRLELCGALLLAKLVNSVKVELKVDNIYAWTDSTIVLAWLSEHPSKWKTFIGNRTSEILNLLPRQHWNHINSQQNPADHPSRGIFPKELIGLIQWWNGPTWLAQEKCNWPVTQIKSISSCLEQKAKQINFFEHKIKYEIFETIINKFSSFPKILRILSYVYRLGKRQINLARSSSLTVKELNYTEQQIIKWAQMQTFEKDINDLKKNLKISVHSKILSLSPFLDDNGVLRVGGRIECASNSYETKHPAILHKTHLVTKLIINYVHQKYLHPGSSLTSHLLRQRYWIVSGRSVIRTEVKNCIQCFRQRAKVSEQLMGNLPAIRVTPARPFSRTGVDYAGPILLASKKGRGAKLTKGYLAIFVCLVTKAIHLEVVSDLTTESFIATLRRFASRRGVPSDIYSDNGSNFVGAKRVQDEVCKFLLKHNNGSIIADYLAQNGTNWHFIPPSAPSFGGLWEAAVKSVKTHLTRVTGYTNLTFEEMCTLLTQIEAILNSRPLCEISEDDSTYEALTPAHFLIGSTLGSIPEYDLDDLKINRLSRWQQVQARVQCFWKRYQREYINNLQQRNKWRFKKENIKINDMVLIHDENLPATKWKLGRITEIHPDAKGVVRVVTVKTASGTVKRPICKLARLPIN